MADFLKRSKIKVALPPGWVEQISKKHPDRPFYFNEKTGERRWSMPVNPEDEVQNGTQRKSKKRKANEVDDEVDGSIQASTSAATKMLNSIIGDRPIVTPKKKSDLVINEKDAAASSNDTPTMRLYREKLAKRKAELEAKKAVKPKPKQLPKSPVKVPDISMPSTSQRRTRRSSVASSDSYSSVASSSSKASSMGAKIQAAAAATPKTPITPHFNRLSKMPRVTLDERIALIKNTPNSDIINKRVEATGCKIIKEIVKATESENAVSVDCDRQSSAKKNLANERLENLRKSLDLQKSPKRSRRTSVNKIISDSPLSKKNRLKIHGAMAMNNLKETKYEEENVQNQRTIEKIETTGMEFEEMEWEPIEDEKLMSEVYSVRNQLCEQPLGELTGLPNDIIMPLDTSKSKESLYIVIDTNVFLSNLSFIEEVRDSKSDSFGRPLIVIPWTVLQELDFIKDDKSKVRSPSLKLKARRAIEFLNRHFASKHPRFLGQTPADVESNRDKFKIDCPDDEILQTCLQIKESSKTSVLLSYDKNLCNKAMIHDILTLGRDEPLEKIYYLKAAETTDFLSHSLHARIEETHEDVTLVQKELIEAEDIMEEIKAVLKCVLAEVVAKEMENLFGSRWEMHVIIRPPWSLGTVLKCALKHWMAAVSESFERKAEPILRDIQICINNIPEGGRKLQDADFFLTKCSTVIQLLNEFKYPELRTQSLSKLESLRERCVKITGEIKDERIKEYVGSEDDENEEKRRAALAFKVLEDLYSFARDICGIASSTLELQCAFVFNKSHPFISPKLALDQQRDVGVQVNILLQGLKAALSKTVESMFPNDRIIIALFEIIVNFSSDLNFEELSKLTPLDLYCCLKLEREKLEKGYHQLEELNVHFCRIANFRGT